MPKERLRPTTKNIEDVSRDTMMLTSRKRCHVDVSPTADAQTNLIINYLPQSMTQEDIKVLFLSAGELESCKLVRDKSTGQSLGYAFVNYKKSANALKAIESFNGLRLQNKAIKVSFARPSSDLIKGANLYICGLAKNFSSSELSALLAPFGQIITSRVLCDPHTGVSKGVGFVRMNLKSQAEKAIRELNGTIPAGCTEPISVKLACQPTFATSYKAQANAQLCAQNLAFQQNITSQYPLVNFNGPLSLNQQPLNYADAAINSSTGMSPLLNGTLQQEEQSLAISSNSAWCLFVFNLPPTIDENFLMTLFIQFGPIQSVKIVRDPGKGRRSKGFGFVNMLRYEDCLAAIAALDGYPIDLTHCIHVSFKKSQLYDAEQNVSELRLAMPLTTLNQVDSNNQGKDCDSNFVSSAISLQSPAMQPFGLGVTQRSELPQYAELKGNQTPTFVTMPVNPYFNVLPATLPLNLFAII